MESDWAILPPSAVIAKLTGNPKGLNDSRPEGLSYREASHACRSGLQTANDFAVCIRGRKAPPTPPARPVRRQAGKPATSTCLPSPAPALIAPPCAWIRPAHTTRKPRSAAPSHCVCAAQVTRPESSSLSQLRQLQQHRAHPAVPGALPIPVPAVHSAIAPLAIVSSTHGIRFRAHQILNHALQQRFQ